MVCQPCCPRGRAWGEAVCWVGVHRIWGRVGGLHLVGAGGVLAEIGVGQGRRVANSAHVLRFRLRRNLPLYFAALATRRPCLEVMGRAGRGFI